MVVLEGIEFESIWKVAHKWANQDPSSSDVNSLDPFVKIRIQKIARAVVLDKLSLRNSDNMPVMDLWLLLNIFWNWKVFWALRDCYFKNKIDKSILDSHYVSRSELFKWCESEYLSFPEFWIEDNSISKIPDVLKERSASQKDKDKAACRALASAFWKIDPRIAPKHMAESFFLKQYGNAGNYKDEKTVKGWIADLDPQAHFRNSGRPPDIKYLIDMKTGGLDANA